MYWPGPMHVPRGSAAPCPIAPNGGGGMTVGICRVRGAQFVWC